MKVLVLSVAVALASALHAQVQPDSSAHPSRFAKAGGAFLRPGSFAGKIVLANAQCALPQSDVEEVAALLTESTRFNIVAIKTSESSPEELLKSQNANFVILLDDRATRPSLLVAIDDHWAKVSFAHLMDDLPGESAKKKFFVSRARKQIIRTFSLLCGGGSSQFPGNIMSAPTVRDLDVAPEAIPADKINAFTAYLTAHGMTQKEIVSYFRACHEGWAPQPTNDIQKAVWDKVHAPPSKPLKITYDKDKQKPVVK